MEPIIADQRLPVIRVGSVVRLKHLKHEWIVVEYEEGYPAAPLTFVGLQRVVRATAKRRQDVWWHQMVLTDATGKDVHVGETYVSQSLADVERVIRY